MKTYLAILAAALLLVPASDGAEAKEYTKDFHESFEVREGCRLRLKHGDGDVTVRPWDRDVLDVTVRYRADSRSFGWGEKRDFDVEFRRDDELIEVIGQEPRSKFIGIKFFNTIEYTYTIRAPRYLELDIRGDDGILDVEDWEGAIECALDDGNVTFANVNTPRTKIDIEDGNIEIEQHRGSLVISGDDGNVRIMDSVIPTCRIEMEDGDIKISDSEGDCDIRSDDGDVELRRFSGGIIEIMTEDGDIDIDFLEGNELDLDVTTDDGNITIELGPGVSAAFTIDVDDGSIRLDAPSADEVKKGRRWMSGTIGDGKGHIKIKTADGRVILRERD